MQEELGQFFLNKISTSVIFPSNGGKTNVILSLLQHPNGLNLKKNKYIQLSTKQIAEVWTAQILNVLERSYRSL